MLISSKKDRQSDDPSLHQSKLENLAKSFLSPRVEGTGSLTLLLTQGEKHTDFNKWVEVPVPVTPVLLYQHYWQYR